MAYNRKYYDNKKKLHSIPVKCPNCGKIYKNKGSLEAHLHRERHPEKMQIPMTAEEKEKRRIRRMKRYYANKEKEAAWAKQWSTSESGRQHRHVLNGNRRKCLENSSKLTLDTIQLVYSKNLEKYKTLTCELCFNTVTKEEAEIEHFIPVSRIKDYPTTDFNSISNLGIAHPKCNKSKGKKTLEEWFIKYPELRKT